MSLADEKKKGPPRLSLDSAPSTRRTLARLLRMRFRGEIDSIMFRDMFYGASSLLGYDKLLADLRIDERLDALEKSLEKKDRFNFDSTTPPPAPRMPRASTAAPEPPQAAPLAFADAEEPEAAAGAPMPRGGARAAAHVTEIADDAPLAPANQWGLRL